ncbi:MAG: PAS domain-containing protein [Rhodospirillaceae bacterium]|nr:PAS domain-containing protein [Rhodospirillaceae bacterium]MDD9927978.1 PAS domain-containing protein [Rhodospirillaceae bacterium]
MSFDKEGLACSAFDQIADAVLIVDKTGAIRHANASAIQLFGYDASAFHGLPIEVIRGPEHSTALRNQIIAQVSAGETWRGRLEFRTKSGAVGTHDTVISPFRDSSGSIVGMVSCNRDISVDNALADENASILEAVRSSNFGVTIADATKPDLPLTFVNRAFERMTGYGFRDIVGQNCRFLQGADTDAAAVANIRRAIQHEEPLSTMLLNYRQDGTRFWNRLQLSPVHDFRGQLQAYMSVQIDITHDMTTLTVERERQKMEQLGLLASGIAHELNNAIQPAVLMSETIGDFLLPDQTEAQGCAEVILRHSIIARDIVNKVLAYARHGETESVQLDLSALLHRVVQLAKGVLPDTIELQTHQFDMAAGQIIEASETEFQQVFLNLLLNATQAMQQSGKIDISVSCLEILPGSVVKPTLDSGLYVRIDVADQGPGIPETDISQIFDPFFTTKPTGEGTGLGLSTAYGIVRDWGGSITAENRNGALFSVYLPVTVRHAADAA